MNKNFVHCAQVGVGSAVGVLVCQLVTTREQDFDLFRPIFVGFFVFIGMFIYQTVKTIEK